MIKLKDIINEALGIEPAVPVVAKQIQSIRRYSFDNSFYDYMRSVENEGKVGYNKNKKLWLPYPDANTGFYAIGYGHKIFNNIELNKFKKGLTDSQVEELLRKDIEHAAEMVHGYIQNKYKVNLQLDKQQLEILTDFAYNLGGLNKFPKFVDAVLRKNWQVAKAEYKRNSQGKELEKRNRLFYNRYLSNV